MFGTDLPAWLVSTASPLGTLVKPSKQTFVCSLDTS